MVNPLGRLRSRWPVRLAPARADFFVPPSSAMPDIGCARKSGPALFEPETLVSPPRPGSVLPSCLPPERTEPSVVIEEPPRLVPCLAPKVGVRPAVELGLDTGLNPAGCVRPVFLRVERSEAAMLLRCEAVLLGSEDVLPGMERPLDGVTPGIVADAVTGAAGGAAPSRQIPSGWLADPKVDFPVPHMEALPAAGAILCALGATVELFCPVDAPALALARASRALSWLGIAGSPEAPAC